MLNCELAMMSLHEMNANVGQVSDQIYYHHFKEVVKFINSVEELLKNNSIKQTPALFKPYEKGD